MAAASPAAESTAPAAVSATAVAVALLPPPPSRFRLASTSAASGVVAGRPPPGVGAGTLSAVAGPAACRRWSKGVAGSPATGWAMSAAGRAAGAMFSCAGGRMGRRQRQR